MEECYIWLLVELITQCFISKDRIRNHYFCYTKLTISFLLVCFLGFFFCFLFTADRKSFCTIHSTGYLKSWPPTKMGLDEDNEPDNEGCNLSCLVAIGRLHPHVVPQPVNGEIRVKPTEYVSRHAIDGKFVFVDQRWEFLQQLPLSSTASRTAFLAAV